MSSSALQAYARDIFTHVPWEHWTIMVVVSLVLTVILLLRKKCSVYGAICMGVTVFFGLLLLDTMVAIRHYGFLKHGTGFNWRFTFNSLFHGDELGRIEMISNVAVFAPWGFFLAEFFAATKRFGAWRRIGCVVLSSLGLSLCIECLQLLLRVGFFEMMDIVLNTLGAFFGAGMAVLGRKVLLCRHDG